jgi:hypothetical protein
MRARPLLPVILLGIAAGAAAEEADLFLTATRGVAVMGSVVEQTSQEPWTVLPVRTSD